MSTPEGAVETAPTTPEVAAPPPAAEAVPEQAAAPADNSELDRWRQKYERADKHLNEKIEALKAQGEQIAALEQKLEESNAAKAEAEAQARKVEELQKQLAERDFQDDVLTGVAPGKLEQARIMIRGLGIDPTSENAAQLAAEQLRKVSPELYASAPVRSANSEDAAMREGLKGKTWGTLSADQRRYVVSHPELTMQLNAGAITHPHPPKEKHRR